MQEISNTVDFDYASIDEAFPPCDPGIEPLGSRVIVQVRTPKSVSKGGIHLITEVRETELANTQTVKVIAVGPLAFKNRNTMALWPEGAWAQPGDFVRAPRYGGDRFTVKNADGEGDSLFVVWNDMDLVAKVTGDPTKFKAFL